MAHPSNLKTLSGLLKLIQIILGSILCALLGSYTIGTNRINQTQLAMMVPPSFLIVSTLFLIGYLFDDNFKKMKIQETVGNLAATVLEVAVGACLINYYHGFSHESEHVRVGLAFGSICLLNGLAYAIDTFFALRQ